MKRESAQSNSGSGNSSNANQQIASDADQPAETVKFSILLKRGSRVKELEVPKESPIAAIKSQQIKAEEEEHTEMKMKTLKYGELQTYDEYTHNVSGRGRGGRGRVLYIPASYSSASNSNTTSSNPSVQQNKQKL